MSALFSFSCYLCLLLVVALFHSSLSIQKFDNDVLCLESERQALLQFKHGLIDEKDRLASWVGEDRDCCRWAGIICDNITGHVHGIHLDGYSPLYGDCDPTFKYEMGGNFSSSLLHLKQLRHLDLSCNDFGGIQVPEFIGSLGNLRYLNLSASGFSGIIPPQLGNLSRLHVLSLGSFREPFESTRMMNMKWLSSLRLLHHLDMSGVNLSQAIDWFQLINTLPSLTQLHLSGRVPSSTQLQSFDESSFFGNKLCGDPLTERCIPTEVPNAEVQKEDDASHGADWGLITSSVLGLVVGFWLIVAPLMVSRAWRIKYFRFLSEHGLRCYA